VGGNAIVDGCHFGVNTVDVHDDACEYVGSVDLSHGSLEHGYSGKVQTLEEDARDFGVGTAGEPREKREQHGGLVLSSLQS
jgi:hypothetical protein